MPWSSPSCLHALEFFVGGRRSVSFDIQQLSDLHSRGANASRHGVDQHAALTARIGRLGRIGSEAGLPVREIGGQKNDGKRCRLHRRPARRLRPDHRGRNGDLLRGGSILRIAHHALARRFDDSGELAASDERRLRSARIGAVGRHGVGEIDTHGFDADDYLLRRRLRLGNLAYFEDFRTTRTSDDDGFHDYGFDSACRAAA